MIAAAIVTMTVLGCSHQDLNCELITRSPKVWLSQQDCEAAIPSLLTEPTDAPYPIFIARCNNGDDTRITQASASQASASMSAKTAVPSTATGDPISIVAADFERHPDAGEDRNITGALLYRTKNGYALIRDGATGGMEILRNSAAGGFALLTSGVKTTAGATSKLADQAATAIRDILPSQE